MDDAALPALAPNLRFDRMSHTASAVDLSFAAKKDALGPHIRARWTWDEDYQRRIHHDRFAEKPFFAITRDGDLLGTLSWWLHPDHIRFGEFYLFAQYQKQGLGTRILRHMLV